MTVFARSVRVRAVCVRSVLIIAMFALLSCTGSAPPMKAEPNSDAAKNSANLPDKMQSLSKTLSSLLPLTASQRKFDAPGNSAIVDEDTLKLRALAHSLKATETASLDPSMQLMSGLLEEDLQRAQESLKLGDRSSARQILKDTTSYCIQCHTQTNNGPGFPLMDLNVKTSDLSNLERAEFFAATRQFDPALAAYKAALTKDGLEKKDPFEWEKAARSAVAIFVRVKGNPRTTRNFLNQISKTRSLPASTNQSVVAWKKSVNEWLHEKRRKSMSVQETISHAQDLIHRAQIHQEFPLDHSQDVVFFRASALLHDLLQKKAPGTLPPELIAKTLYLVGLTAEATRDMNFWTLYEVYYEQCIRKLPHSEQAKQCFERLKESTTLGYSGSAGTIVPPEVNHRLEIYGNLAGPLASGDSQPPPVPAASPSEKQ
jgi:hypothetical protein